jgi:CubicO group peptidase (beta-lactamase class C family)
VEQLLLHESGVGEIDSPALMRHCVSSDEMVHRIAKVPPFFAPGTSDRYSNEGYVLLACYRRTRFGYELRVVPE